MGMLNNMVVGNINRGTRFVHSSIGTKMMGGFLANFRGPFMHTSKSHLRIFLEYLVNSIPSAATLRHACDTSAFASTVLTISALRSTLSTLSTLSTNSSCAETAASQGTFT